MVLFFFFKWAGMEFYMLKKLPVLDAIPEANPLVDGFMKNMVLRWNATNKAPRWLIRQIRPSLNQSFKGSI